MQAQDEDDMEEFDAEGLGDEDDELESDFEDPSRATRHLGDARANEIRRRIEDLKDKRRFDDFFEDLD